MSLLYYNILSIKYDYQPFDTFNFTPLTIEISKIVKQEKTLFLYTPLLSTFLYLYINKSNIMFNLPISILKKIKSNL